MAKIPAVGISGVEYAPSIRLIWQVDLIRKASKWNVLCTESDVLHIEFETKVNLVILVGHAADPADFPEGAD